MITNEHIEPFVTQAHRVGDAGLTIYSSGNLSWRIGDSILQLKPVRTKKEIDDLDTYILDRKTK